MRARAFLALLMTAVGAGAVPSHADGPGVFLVGAAKRSISPADIPNSPWQPAVDGHCGSLPVNTPLDEPGCLLTFDMLWAKSVDPLGVWARAIVIGNGKTGEPTVALVVLDVVGWFWGYPPEICDRCGARDIALAIAEETGGAIPARAVILASSHTHASANTLAEAPGWYFEFVRDQAIAAVLAAKAAMVPAVIETGAVAAKAYNVDRRIVNRAVPDPELGWVRARAWNGEAAGATIATVANFAAHPTVRVSNDTLHSGFGGPLVQHLEAELPGSVGLFFSGAIGDQKVDRGFRVHGLGVGLATLILEDLPHAYTLQTNDIQALQMTVKLPVENQFLVGAGLGGVFVREFQPPYGGGPEAVAPMRGRASVPMCAGAAALHVVAPVSGIRLGRPGTSTIAAPNFPGVAETDGKFPDPGDSVAIMAAPGEIFASIGVVTKDYLSRTRNVLVLGLANDQIGYMPPSNQYDVTAGQGLGLLHNATGTGNYEEALGLGRCTGDVVQNMLLEIGWALGVNGSGEER